MKLEQQKACQACGAIVEGPNGCVACAATEVRLEPIADENELLELDRAAMAAHAKERRERIATAALHGILASNPKMVSTGTFDPAVACATSALQCADALIAALDGMAT